MNVFRILFVLLPILAGRDGAGAYAALCANRRYAAWLGKQSVLDQEVLEAAGPLFMQGLIDSLF